MHLQAVFLFTQKIGKFFSLTAWDLLNSIYSEDCVTKLESHESGIDLKDLVWLIFKNFKVSLNF